MIKLADGKERTFQHMSASTFWDASGKPISAAQFVESLFGQLPELFRDEDELRAHLEPAGNPRSPDRRPGRTRLRWRTARHKSARMIDAEESDLFDVLDYIAHTKHPLKRAERAECTPRQHPLALRRQAAGVP